MNHKMQMKILVVEGQRSRSFTSGERSVVISRPLPLCAEVTLTRPLNLRMCLSHRAIRKRRTPLHGTGTSSTPEEWTGTSSLVTGGRQLMC